MQGKNLLYFVYIIIFMQRNSEECKYQPQAASEVGLWKSHI